MRLVATLLLTVFFSVAYANGGLSIDTVEKHMLKPALNKTSDVSIDHARLAHGPIDKFQVGENKPKLADTSENKNSADSSI